MPDPKPTAAVEQEIAERLVNELLTLPTDEWARAAERALEEYAPHVTARHEAAQRDYDKLRLALEDLGLDEWEDTVTAVCDMLREIPKLEAERDALKRPDSTAGNRTP